MTGNALPEPAARTEQGLPGVVGSMLWLCSTGALTRIYTSNCRVGFFISMTKLELFWLLRIVTCFPPDA